MRNCITHGRRWLATLTLAGGALVAVATCGATERGWGGSVVATTDYVYRGVSQTLGDAALQADVHYRGASGWFAGLWGSNVDRAAGYIGGLEVNAYAGWAWAPTADWTARLAWVRYLYPDSRVGTTYDYDDISANLGFRDRVYLTADWMPHVTRFTANGPYTGHEVSAELSLRQPLPHGFTVSAGAGYFDLSDTYGATYWSWSASLSHPLGPIELDLSHFGNAAAARRLFGHAAADDRWVLTAVWRY